MTRNKDNKIYLTDFGNQFIKLANEDFPSLAQKYGLMCKGLVENPEQRTNYWETKGAKIIKWKEKN